MKDWAKVGEFGKTEGAHGGVWECPDLFPLPVEGSNELKWVLIVNVGNGAPSGGSGGQYFIGQFDGKTFKDDNKPTDILWLDYGKDNYATVTWSGSTDNRRISLGWMTNWQYANKVPTKAWRSAMTLPRELSLANTPQGIRLMQKPVKETELLRGVMNGIAAQDVDHSFDLKQQVKTNELSLTFDLNKTTSTDFGVQLSNSKGEKVLIGYEKTTNRFYIDRTEGGQKDFSKDFAGCHYAPRIATDNTLMLHLMIDVASVELFADKGSVVLTDTFFPNEDFSQLSLFAKNGVAHLVAGNVWGLK